MSLDIVEFIMEVEEEFGILIPDEVAETITTPRKLVDYIFARVPHNLESRCLSQRAFYTIRRVLIERVGVPRSSLRPGTELLSILPAQNAEAVWSEVGQSLGYRCWPSVHRNNWLTRLFVDEPPRTLGEVARSLAVFSTGLIKPAGERWSWNEVAAVITKLINDHFLIELSSLDDRFVEDLGLY